MKYYILLHRITSGKLKKRKALRWLKKISHHFSPAKIRPLFKEKMQRKIHLKIYSSVACLSLSLTGCMGIYEGGFECPADKGVGCKSISEVNTMIDWKRLPGLRVQEIETDSYDRQSSDSFQIWYAPLMNQVREKASCPASNDKESGFDTLKGCKEEDGSLSI